MSPILAHGALGIYDEVVFILVAAIFLALMAVAWLRSRSEDPTPVDDATPIQPIPTDTDTGDQFRLE